MFWLGAIVSLCYVPSVTGAYIATQWPVLAVALLPALWRSGTFTWVHGIGLAFVAYALAHITWALTPYAAVFGSWLVVTMALCVWFGTTLTDVRGLYAGLAVGGGVSSAVAIAQYAGWKLIPMTSIVPAGLYVNSVQQGTVLALITIALVSERMWLHVVPLLPGLALSHSRGAWLALAVGLVGCKVRRLWVFVLVGFAGLFYLLTPISSSDAERLLIWQTAWHNLTLFGWGPGSFYTILLQHDGHFFFPEHAHNDALQLAFEYGICAALPLAVFAFALSQKEAREWPVILAFIAAGCYSMPLWMPVASFLALTATGRVLRRYALARSDSDRSGQFFLSWRYSFAELRRKAVPVAPHLEAKR